MKRQMKSLNRLFIPILFLHDTNFFFLLISTIKEEKKTAEKNEEEPFSGHDEEYILI